MNTMKLFRKDSSRHRPIVVIVLTVRPFTGQSPP